MHPSINLSFHRLFKKGTFLNNVAAMLSANIAAQIIALSAAPVITRLYLPDDFGIMVYLTSIVNILSVTATLRYENAIVLPSEDKDASQLFIFCITSAFIISCFYGLIIGVYNNLLVDILGKKWLRSWLWVVPFGVFIASVYRTLTYIYTRYKLFRLLASTRVAVRAGGAFVKIFFGYALGASVIWLIAGNIGAPIIAIFILGYVLYLKRDLYQLRTFSTKGTIAILRRYKKFPTYSLPTELLNSVGQNLPVLLLAFFFPQNVIGYYGLANSILRRPISIMGESFSKVFLQKVVEDHNAGRNIRKQFLKGTVGLAAIGSIPFAILACCGAWLFTVIFGQNWEEAGLYAQILAPWLFLGFVNPPSTQIIIAKQALRFNFFFNLILLLFRSIVIILGSYLSNNILCVLILFSGCGIIFNIIYIYYAFILTE